MLPTSGTTIRVPTKSQRSPACAVSTASALRITSTLQSHQQQNSSTFDILSRLSTDKHHLSLSLMYNLSTSSSSQDNFGLLYNKLHYTDINHILPKTRLPELHFCWVYNLALVNFMLLAPRL